MTEADWQAGRTRDELILMIGRLTADHLDGRRWLFGAACLRRIWDLLHDNRFRLLVEAAEARGRGEALPEPFEIVRGRLPRIGNWRQPVPSAMLWEADPVRIPMGVGSPPANPNIPPPGVLNFRELPFWAQQTHHATVCLGETRWASVADHAASARADHTAEQSTELKPFDDQIAVIDSNIGRHQRKYDDAVWRGLSSAAKLGEELRMLREQADAERRQIRDAQSEQRKRIADAALADEHAAQAELLRCVFGNPFRAVVFSPTWRTETVTTLVQGILADAAFDRLPILADALEEAGCDSADLLAHCRGPGPHSTDCWVLAGLR
jgi:hypothetical protein